MSWCVLKAIPMLRDPRWAMILNRMIQVSSFDQRRNALRQLIDSTHSRHSSLKILAAGEIRHFFKDFPDLEEEAINAIYDLCEDQDSQVSNGNVFWYV
jgi:Apoptosis inhibitory protein 5 (API5)